MYILPANTIKNISSNERIICHLPNSEVTIELLPKKIKDNHWKIVLKIIDLSQKNLPEKVQEIDYQNFSRYHVGYYKDKLEEQRYAIMNLLPLLEEEKFPYRKNEALLWFQMGKNALEVQSALQCEVEQN